MVNDEEKASIEASGRDREGERKRIAADVSKIRDDIETGVSMQSRERAWRVPAYWPGGVRHTGGASPVCGLRAEQEKAGLDTSPLTGGERGSVPGGPKP
ncbi:hypothetical protein GCM10009560_59110 [Nonomuraea longicatena]|uniref:Uncharacterized protein n=1 Tax=Nonomuraea longicatena TaxID=83682 RepID=A0ABN1QMR9_9ACTN